MSYAWQPAVADVSAHLRRWTEGGLTGEQTDAITAFIDEATADVAGEVGQLIPVELHRTARVAATYLAAYRFIRSWHPEEDDLLLGRYREDHEAAMQRLATAVRSTSPQSGRRRYGSPRLGSDFVRRTHDGV